MNKLSRILASGRVAQARRGSSVDLRDRTNRKYASVDGRIRGLISALLSGEPSDRLPPDSEGGTRSIAERFAAGAVCRGTAGGRWSALPRDGGCGPSAVGEAVGACFAGCAVGRAPETASSRESLVSEYFARVDALTEHPLFVEKGFEQLLRGSDSDWRPEPLQNSRQVGGTEVKFGDLLEDADIPAVFAAPNTAGISASSTVSGAGGLVEDAWWRENGLGDGQGDGVGRELGRRK